MKVNNSCLSPKETSDILIQSAQNKASLAFEKRIMMSIMAGLYIALGGQGFIVTFDSLFLRAAVFPVGLMLVVLVGGELFTGNCLMTFAFLQKKISGRDYFKSLIQVYFGNFAGALIAVFLLYFSGIYKNPALAKTIETIVKNKISLSFSEALFKGILCNILVSLGVWFATTARDTTGKLLGCWFPVMLFVLCGYEHCVANMFFLPMGMMLNAPINLSQLVLNNLLPVTIGNFIGGGILVPLVYTKVYYK